MLEQLQQAKNYLAQNGIERPEAGIVLGTGLHELINFVGIKQNIPYKDIPGFPVSTVESHKGNLVYGKIGDKHVLIMQGRFHAYEGYTLQQVVFPVRVMKLLGVQQLFLSNAAGGINLNFKKGDLVLIDDHINLLNGSPLSGKNHDELGSRFPDMSEPYDAGLKNLLQATAGKLTIPLKKGVYAAVHGPNLETKAEYRFLKVIGADLVGMSTVPEVIVGRHQNIPCFAISIVTDLGGFDEAQKVSHEEVLEVATAAEGKMTSIIKEMIEEL